MSTMANSGRSLKVILVLSSGSTFRLLAAEDDMMKDPTKF